MKKFTIIVGIGIALNLVLNVVLSLVFKRYYSLIAAAGIPVVWIFLVKSKFFVKIDDQKLNTHLIIGSIVNQIYLLLLGTAIAVSCFDAFIECGFIACCALSVGYTVSYEYSHEHLMKVSKKYFFIFFFVAVLFTCAVTFLFLLVPKEYLMQVIGEGATLYDIFPFIIAGKLIADILFAADKFPAI